MAQPFTVQDFMSANLITLSPEMEILKAARILAEKRISSAPVVDHTGHLVGVLAEQDCLRAVFRACYHEEWGGHVEEYMQPGARRIEADTSIADVAQQWMECNDFRSFTVTKEGRLMGQFSIRDALKAFEALSHS
jgi:predicted transcriptional regulator